MTPGGRSKPSGTVKTQPVQATARLRFIDFSDTELHHLRNAFGTAFGKIRLVRGSKTKLTAEFSIAVDSLVNPGGIHGSLMTFQAFSLIVEEILKKHCGAEGSVQRCVEILAPNGVGVARRILIRSLRR